MVVLAGFLQCALFSVAHAAEAQGYFAPGLIDSPLRLFKQLFDEVMTVAAWKHMQNVFEADGSICLLVEDVNGGAR